MQRAISDGLGVLSTRRVRVGNNVRANCQDGSLSDLLPWMAAVSDPKPEGAHYSRARSNDDASAYLAQTTEIPLHKQIACLISYCQKVYYMLKFLDYITIFFIFP